MDLVVRAQGDILVFAAERMRDCLQQGRGSHQCPRPATFHVARLEALFALLQLPNEPPHEHPRPDTPTDLD
jgi:hypothetical protein